MLATRTLPPEQWLKWPCRADGDLKYVPAAMRLGDLWRMLERGIRGAEDSARVPRYIL